MSRDSQASFPDVDRFELLHELGSGGMGVVYAVFDRQRGEKVALKTLQREDPAALLRLKNEFRALQDLQHPNLVTLGELFHEHQQWFFTMELVAGVDFISYVRGAGPISLLDGASGTTLRRDASDVSSVSPPERGDVGVDDELDSLDGEVRSNQVLRPAPVAFDEVKLRACLAQLAEGLAVIHAADRVHRDIKPGNILVEHEGRLVLLDFGLITQIEPGQRSVEHFFPLGTIGYMAPEQAASKEVSPAADWYSVGVVLFEALTGQLPFTGGALKVLAEKQLSTPRRPRDIVPDVPQDLDELCALLLDRDPQRRPGAAQVLQAARSGQFARPSGRQVGLPVPPTRIFVGRRSELASMFEAHSAVAAGEASSVLVYGQSGVGKSELLRTFARKVLAREPGTMVLHGRCYERESVPYKAFDGVVDSLSQQLAGRPAAALAGLVPGNISLLLRLFPVLGRVESFRSAPPIRFEVEDLQEVRSLAFQALRELFVRLAERQIVIVTIDDLQWADEDSKKLLRALAHPPQQPKLLLLTAMRTAGDEREAEQAVTDLLEAFPERPQVLALGPLSREESRELAQALATEHQSGGIDADRRLDQIARESEGHPLFLRELVQHASGLQDDGVGPGDAALRLDDALWARISQLEREARDLVELVAVATSPLSQRIIAAAAGIGEAEMFRLAGRLRTERLVRTSGPGLDRAIDAYHDRVREAVLAKTSDTVLRHWHGRLAEAMLASESQEAERLAFHLENAGRSAEAARYAAQAGEQAAKTLAFKRAAELFRQALATWPEPESDEQTEARRQLQVNLGEALGNAGRGPESADAYQLAVPGAPATEALELKRRAAEQLLRSGHVEHGLRVVREVLAAVGMKLPQSTLGALLSLLWQRLRLRLRGLRFRVQELDQIPPDAIIQADVCNAISQGLAMIDTVRGAYFSTRFVGLALDMGERARVIRALWMEASYAANTALPERYVARLHAAMDSLVDEREPLTHAYLHSARGCVCFMNGQWAEALDRFESTEVVFTSRGGNVWERTTFRFFICWSLYYLGELAELTRRIMPLHADAVDRGDRYAACGMLLGLTNVAHLNAHGAVETRRLIREAKESWTTERYYLRDYYAFLAETQVDLYEGEGASAHQRVVENWPRLRRSLLLMIPSVRIEADHLRARAALAAGARLPPRQHGALLSEATTHVRRLTRQRASWAKALALPLEAAVAMQRNDRERALTLLRDAVNTLERLEMKLYATAARRRLGEVLGGEEGAAHCAQADRFLAEQQVKEPAHLVAMLTPGFDPPA